MASKIFVLCAFILLVQFACGQKYVSPTATVRDNSVVNNDIYLSGAELSRIGGIQGLTALTTSGSLSGINNLAGSGISSGLGSGFGGNLATNLASYNIVSGSPLAVTSVSPIGPSGLAVASENVLEGVLTVTGQLPFLSAVAFEGPLPTSGSGVATCGCGNGNVGIISEGLPQASVLPGPGIARVY